MNWHIKTTFVVASASLIIVGAPKDASAQRPREQAICDDCYEWVDSLGYSWHHFSDYTHWAGWWVGVMDGRSGDGYHQFWLPGLCEEVHDYGSCGEGKHTDVAVIERGAQLARLLGNPNYLVVALDGKIRVRINGAGDELTLYDCGGSLVESVSIAPWSVRPNETPWQRIEAAPSLPWDR